MFEPDAYFTPFFVRYPRPVGLKVIAVYRVKLTTSTKQNKTKSRLLGELYHSDPKSKKRLYIDIYYI